jgi:leukotriene-A4 hydrolase
MAVMSADNPTEKSADGIYNFDMPQPIPTYLIALAVGDLNICLFGRKNRRLYRTQHAAKMRV